MEALPEIPVLEEHEESQQQAAPEQPAPSASAPADSLSESPQLVPAAAGATAGVLPLRLPADLASSLHSDWEVVSGDGSHCGSSPRSVTQSDAYDSEAETAAPAQPAPGDGPAPAEDAPAPTAADEQPTGADEGPAVEQGGQLGSFGSAVLASEASEATDSAGASPRSSYDLAPSLASRHDVYSVSQDGTSDTLTDDEHVNCMMLQAEPDRPAPTPAHSAAGGSDDEAPALGGKPSLAAPPVAVLIAAAREGAAAASRELRVLAASVAEALAGVPPAAATVAQHVVHGVARLVDSLVERMAALPQGLAQLAAAMQPGVASAAQRTSAAVQRARKQLGVRRVDWARVAVVLGVACGGLAVALYRSQTEQARLALALARREADLGRLLSKVMELQRNITQRHTPLIRHVAAHPPPPFWPAVIVV